MGIKPLMHIHDAIEYVVAEPGNKVRHKMWRKEYYVYMTPAGNFKYHTPEGNFHWDWLKSIHPKMGWKVVKDEQIAEPKQMAPLGSLSKKRHE